MQFDQTASKASAADLFATLAAQALVGFAVGFHAQPHCFNPSVESLHQMNPTIDPLGDTPT
jgi:hypothetical protein